MRKNLGITLILFIAFTEFNFGQLNSKHIMNNDENYYNIVLVKENTFVKKKYSDKYFISNNTDTLSKLFYNNYYNEFPNCDTGNYKINNRSRDLTVFGGIGLAETFVFGIGFPISEKLNISFKNNLHVSGVALIPGFAHGFGIKMSYFLNPDLFFNVVNFEYTYLLGDNESSTSSLFSSRYDQGDVIEINIGNEEKKRGWFWYWYIGVAQTILKDGYSQTLPSFKFGINWNIKF